MTHYFITELWNGLWISQAEARNDCLYRYMQKSKYIAFIDLDEYILPKGSIKTWKQMTNTLNHQIVDYLGNICAFSFRTNHFITRNQISDLPTTKDVSVPLVNRRNISHLVAKYDIKTIMYLTRDKVTREGRVNKVIVIPEQVLIVGTHRVELGLRNSKQHVVNKNIATNQHYRIPKIDVGDRLSDREYFLSFIYGLDNSSVADDTVLKYAEELVTNIELTHKNVNGLK